MKKLVLILALPVILITALLAGCGGAEPAYASPMTDNLLSGIEQKDYSIFSRDLDDSMKAEITEDGFNSLVDLLASKVGSYQSKTFGDAAETTQNGVAITTVIYKARYTNEPADVLITVTFIEEDGTRKIDGLLFNSPKLRGQ